MAIMMYRNDNTDYFPPLIYDYAWGWGTNVTGQNRWFNYLERYTKSYNVFNCAVYNDSDGWIYGHIGNDTRVANVDKDGASWMIRGRALVGGTCNYSYNSANVGGYVQNGSSPGTMKKFVGVSQLLRRAGKSASDGVAVMDGVFMVNSPGVVDNYQLHTAYRYIHPNKTTNV